MMTVRAIATVSALTLSALTGAHAEATPRLSATEIADIQSNLPSCESNVCFAFEGSDLLSAEEFESQLEFILDVTAVIGDLPGLGELDAVQFAGSTRLVEESANTTEFAANVAAVEQLGSGAVITVGGINVCFSQLFNARSNGKALSLVLLGTGNSNLGSSPVARADLLRSLGGEVFSVAAGDNADIGELLAIAGGDANNLFDVDGNGNIVAEIDGIVNEICN